jgi:glycosyltransferase involved in cell wall biosynthesis
MQIKVCHLSSAHSPFDDRIFHKEAKSLSKAGYDIAIIAQHNKEETLDGVRIIPLPKPSNRFERMTKTSWKLFRLALKQKAAIYHFHDPELIPIGVVLKILGKKVIYDVHEDYPKQILYKEWIGSYIFRKIASVVFGIFEKFSVKTFNSVVAATPDIAKNFPEDRTMTLKNLSILELIDKAEPDNHKVDKPVIIYAGGISKIRGIAEIIQAMEFIGDRAEFWILGKWTSQEYRNYCESLPGWKHTRDLGFVPLGQVYEYMKKATIGASILYPVKNYITSLPVKAYEYMACSLPMVMSNFPYWEQIFGECALFADPYSPKEIADKIMYLVDNPDKARQLADKGRQLVVDEYNWENESKKLLELYEGLFHARQENK